MKIHVQWYVLVMVTFLITCCVGAQQTKAPYIKQVQGTAYHKTANTPYQPAQQNAPAQLNDMLKTEPGSSIDVQFNVVNVLRLLPETEMRVRQLPDSAGAGTGAERVYNFALMKGEMVTKIKKLPEHTRMEVQTPVAIAGARGTAFAVTADESGTRITGLESTIEVTSNETGKKSVSVPPNKWVSVSPWVETTLTAIGSGVLSETILDSMVKESMDKISIRADGVGTTTQNARAGAENKLADIITQIKISEDKNLTDLMFDDAPLAGKLFELIATARTIAEQPQDDGTVIVTIELTAEQIQSLIQSKINVWRTVRQITRSEYMQQFPALARVTTERAAKLDGYRRLAEKIYGTVVSSKTTIQDMAVQNDTVTNTVEGMVKGAREIETKYFSDGSIQMTLAIDGIAVRDGLNSATGQNLGEQYVTSPNVIKYNEYKFIQIFREFE